MNTEHIERKNELEETVDVEITPATEPRQEQPEMPTGTSDNNVGHPSETVTDEESHYPRRDCKMTDRHILIFNVGWKEIFGLPMCVLCHVYRKYVVNWDMLPRSKSV